MSEETACEWLGVGRAEVSRVDAPAMMLKVTAVSDAKAAKARRLIYGGVIMHGGGGERQGAGRDRRQEVRV